MSTEEQETRASGSVPHAYGNALAWRWSREMPTALRRGFLTLLYAMRAMANANGELRFHGDRKPIRIQDIAKAACVREKDARRYLEAATHAGVVGIRGERRRGVATLYVLLLSPAPDWTAAEAHLTATARKPGKASAPWVDTDESSGRGGPNQIGITRRAPTTVSQRTARVSG
ncbi:FaeA/PapI family transcriptional regulator, partial [Streptomyces sp. NPDC052115]|uniref:FaeA/PapI family transcriptional regulator n=1 Tax=Streptomyces sp. NPDC052115 TaxID=3155794 RepID=UPI0034345A67